LIVKTVKCRKVMEAGAMMVRRVAIHFEMGGPRLIKKKGMLRRNEFERCREGRVLNAVNKATKRK
jgi:hypothetical protein